MRLTFALALLVALAGCDAAAPSPALADAKKASSDGFLVTTFDANGNSSEHRQDKVDVCHYDDETATYKRISVGAPAFSAHIERHPDGVPGGEVPGADVASTFGESCEVVPVVRFTCEATQGTISGADYSIRITLTAVDPALLPLADRWQLSVTENGLPLGSSSGSSSGSFVTGNIGIVDPTLTNPTAVLTATGAYGTPLACGPYVLERQTPPAFPVGCSAERVLNGDGTMTVTMLNILPVDQRPAAGGGLSLGNGANGTPELISGPSGEDIFEGGVKAGVRLVGIYTVGADDTVKSGVGSAVGPGQTCDFVVSDIPL